MKKIYLHIGFHKTGTSAIQEHLNSNRKGLLDCGILYPESFETKYPSHVDFSWAFKNNQPAWSCVTDGNKDEIINSYRVQIEETDCGKIILSSEDFSLLDTEPDSIKNLKEFLTGFSVKVIAYIREPIDFIVSLYSHAIRKGDISCSLKSYLVNHYRFRSANYPLRLNPWINNFGKENIIVNKYSKESFEYQSLTNHFLDSIKANYSFDAPPPRSNVGVHPWLMEAYIRVYSSNLESEIKNRQLNHLLKLGPELPKEDPVKYLLNQDDEKIIRNFYSVSNSIIYREFNIRLT